MRAPITATCSALLALVALLLPRAFLAAKYTNNRAFDFSIAVPLLVAGYFGYLTVRLGGGFLRILGGLEMVAFSVYGVLVVLIAIFGLV